MVEVVVAADKLHEGVQLMVFVEEGGAFEGRVPVLDHGHGEEGELLDGAQGF